jgi:glycosidase
MKNFKDPTDAEVRKDFPGGWPGDKENKFTATGRSAQENEAFDFVKKLATYRRDHKVLHNGKLMQYLPENGLYVYFRYDASSTVMVASNATDKAATLPTARFAERLAGFTKARNVLTGEPLSSLATLQLPAKTAVVLELGK